jgi:pimeloyl-ACP methyl ester carboxylesterase
VREEHIMGTTRAFTVGRVIALGLIAVVVVGLGYLRFAPNDAISVPAGSQAGDLTLESCEYATEAGSYAADCGTLVVPENRANPRSRLIALPVTRIKARSENPSEPVFRLQGGPGITNMSFSKASRLADDHDVVIVGYRGVDGSSVLDCPEVESALKHSNDLLGEKSLLASADAYRSCADRLADDGVDLAGYTLPQRVDDLEAARVALGYERVNLVSESVGTRTAMIYAWRYPRSINRSVMIGVNPPGYFLWDAKATDEQIGRFADLCSRDDTCSKRTDDLAASLTTDIPERWFFLPIKRGNVQVASFYGLMETTQENAPLAGPMTLSSWLSAEEGDPSGFWLQSLLADMFFPGSFVWGEYAAAAILDAHAANRYFSSERRESRSNLGRAATTFGWAGGRLSDAWPASPDDGRYSRVRTSNVETLIVSGELDITTPPQVARKELLPYLPNGEQLVLPGFGHSLDFWTYQPEASTRLLNTFYESGRVDDSLYEPQRVDFTPEVTQTALAKGIAGTMLGLAVLAVLSLPVMWWRMHRRGRIGRKSSALLRSVYAVVLGLGGWFMGVLIVVTTMPGTPLDDELLVALSIGVPIGLGVYFAWVHRAFPATRKWAGVALATGGGMAGAWLGFHAAVDLLALVTAIVGAIVGANVTLILFDVASARRARDPFAEITSRVTLDARLPSG